MSIQGVHVQVEETRTKAHNFTLNVEEQVKRLIQSSLLSLGHPLDVRDKQTISFCDKPLIIAEI